MKTQCTMDSVRNRSGKTLYNDKKQIQRHIIHVSATPPTQSDKKRPSFSMYSICQLNPYIV